MQKIYMLAAFYLLVKDILFPSLNQVFIGWLTNRGSYGVANLPALRTGGASRCFKGHFGSSCKDKD